MTGASAGESSSERAALPRTDMIVTCPEGRSSPAAASPDAGVACAGSGLYDRSAVPRAAFTVSHAASAARRVSARSTSGSG